MPPEASAGVCLCVGGVGDSNQPRQPGDGVGAHRGAAARRPHQGGHAHRVPLCAHRPGCRPSLDMQLGCAGRLPVSQQHRGLQRPLLLPTAVPRALELGPVTPDERAAASAAPGLSRAHGMHVSTPHTSRVRRQPGAHRRGAAGPGLQPDSGVGDDAGGGRAACGRPPAGRPALPGRVLPLRERAARPLAQLTHAGAGRSRRAAAPRDGEPLACTALWSARQGYDAVSACVHAEARRAAHQQRAALGSGRRAGRTVEHPSSL